MLETLHPSNSWVYILPKDLATFDGGFEQCERRYRVHLGSQGMDHFFFRVLLGTYTVPSTVYK